MIRYLSISEVLELHKRIISETGGAPGLRDFRAVESSLSHIKQTFNQSDLYPELIDKAASLCFSLVINHPFVYRGHLSSIGVSLSSIVYRGQTPQLSQLRKSCVLPIGFP